LLALRSEAGGWVVAADEEVAIETSVGEEVVGGDSHLATTSEVVLKESEAALAGFTAVATHAGTEY